MAARTFHSRLAVSVVLLLLVPVPGTVSGWEPVSISPASVAFPSGGGNASTTIRVPADGLVKGFGLNVSGFPSYANYTYSANTNALWEGERRNLSLGGNGIGLGGFGSWWEETVNLSGNATRLSPVLNVSAYSRVMVQGENLGPLYSIEVLDPMQNNKSLQKGLRNGDALNLSLWTDSAPYRELVLRLTVAVPDAPSNPVVRRWGVGTGWRGGEAIITTPSRDEIPIATAPHGEFSPDIAVDTKNNFIVTWVDDRNSTTTTDIYARRFDSNGNKLGNEIPVSLKVLSDDDPAIAVDSNDNFIVAWVDTRDIYFQSLDIVAQRFASNGSKLGDLIAVAREQGPQLRPDVGAVSDGNFIVTWDDPGRTWNPVYVFAKRFYSNGTQYENEIVVGAGWGNKIAFNSKDNAIITYQCSRWHNDHYEYDLYAQWLYQNWTVGNEFTVTWVGGDQSNPVVAVGPSDELVITWVDNRGGNNSGIYAQKFDSNGYKIGNEIAVSIGAKDEGSPDVGFDSRGNFIIAWVDNRNGNWDIYAQWFDSNGKRLGNEVTVSTVVGNQTNPRLAVDSKDNIIIIWQDERNGNADIYARRFPPVYLPSVSITTPPLSPFLHTYGNLFVNATTPPNTGYWVNVTDINNNTLLSYLKNGDPILVNATQYPKIRLNLTLWTDDGNATPVVHEWGYGTRRELGNNFEDSTFDRVKRVANAISLVTEWRWVQKASGGVGRFHHGAVWDAQNNQMIVYGGAGTTGDLDDTWVYYPSNDTWAQKINGPSHRTGFATVWDSPRNQMLISGGWSGTGFLQETWAYHPLSNLWAQKADAPVALDIMRAVWDVQNEQMIYYGGEYAPWSFTNVTYAYIPSNNSWLQKANGPVGRGQFAAAWDSQNKQMLVFGGLNGGGSVLNDTWAYVPSNNRWIKKSDAPFKWGAHTAVWDDQNNRVLLFGGWDDWNTIIPKNETWAYYPSNDTWFLLERAGPPARGLHTAVWDEKNKEMIIFGGTNEGSFTTRFNDTWAYVPRFAGPGSVTTHAVLSITPFSLSSSWLSSTPPNTSLSVRLRVSTDNRTWSDWVKITPNTTYYSSNFTMWGPYLQYNITLSTSDTNVTPVLRDFRIEYNPYLTNGSLNSAIPIPQSALEGVIVAARPVIQSKIQNPKSKIAIELSADNGTTWQRFENNTWATFTAPGAALRWRLQFEGDGNGTPLVSGLAVNYTTETFPSDVTVDVGGDGTAEWRYNGTLSGTAPADGLAAALNGYLAAHRNEADAEGYITVPLNITSRTGGVVGLGDAAADTAPFPQVVGHSPDGTEVAPDTPITLSFSAAMESQSVLDSIVITPALATNPSWSDGGKNLTLNHSGLAANTTYNVTLRSGALSSEGAPLVKYFSWEFTTRPSPAAPRVLAHGPTGTNVSLNATIFLLFGEAMDRPSVAGALSVTPSLNRTENWTTERLNLTLTHSGLVANTTYNVTLRAGALSAAGVPMPANYSWEFRTAPRPSGLPARPQLRAKSPLGTGIALTAPIRLEFDRPMNLSSVRATFTIEPPIEGAWTVSGDGKVLTFTPATGYRPGTKYSVTLRGTAADTSGNALDGNINWQFTTVPEAGTQRVASFPWYIAAILLLALAAVAAVALRRRRTAPAGPRAETGHVEPHPPPPPQPVEPRQVQPPEYTEPEPQPEPSPPPPAPVTEPQTGPPPVPPTGEWEAASAEKLERLGRQVDERAAAGVVVEEERNMLRLAASYLKLGDRAKTERHLELVELRLAAVVAPAPPELEAPPAPELEPELPPPPVEPPAPAGKRRRHALAARGSMDALKEAEAAPRIIGSDAVPFRLQQLLLIYQDGRLMASARSPEAGKVDKEIFSAMLTAIQNFVKDSFAEGGGMNRVSFRKRQILIERGPQMYIACVTTGEMPAEFRHKARKLLQKIWDRKKEFIKHWDGNTTALGGVEDALETFVMMYGG